MKVAILGTRGIPNHHGGFEQFADFFSDYLKEVGIDISVYCSSLHPYKEEKYNGINLIHCNDPEDKIGTAGQFLYDLNCIMDARKRNFDVILQLGYTSSSIWHFLMPKKAVVITNMDGLEWKRTKYSNKVKAFLKYAEKLAAKKSDFLISDSVGIQQHIKKTYGKESKFIAYGATLFNHPDVEFLKLYNLQPYNYDLLIARMEPENNIETIVKGYVKKKSPKTLYLVGNYEATNFGKELYKNYSQHPSIKFLGAIYNLEILNNLRFYSDLYWHGHSVGGTNPSLLEAMASDCCIIAHANIFNKSILGEDAYYFENENDIADMLISINKKNPDVSIKIEHNRTKIKEIYNWDNINGLYLSYMKECWQLKNS